MLVLFFCCALMAQTRSDLDELRARVADTMQRSGPYAPEMEVLFQKILEIDPHQNEALGGLAVHKLHSGDIKAALKWFRKLSKETKASKHTRSIAGDLSSALQTVMNNNLEVAIPNLRHLAASIYLVPKEEKEPLHQGIEHEVLQLTNSLWAGIRGNRGGPIQGETPSYVPGLLAKPFWEPESFDLVSDLENISSTIALEVEAMRKKSSSWKAVGHHTSKKDETILRQGSWKDILIWSHGKYNKKNCKQMPKTCEFVKQHPEITTNPVGIALVSELLPGAEIVGHAGTTNAEITFHLGLRVPAGNVSGLRVGGINRSWNEGRVLVFDDSFDHEVWHRGDDASGPRTVFLLRAWHPEVSPLERQVALHQMLNGATYSRWEEDDIEEALKYYQSKNAQERWRSQLEQLRLRNDGNRKHPEL